MTEEAGLFGLLTEQLIVLATVAGAVAAMPALLEWLAERRRRREFLALSLDEVDLRTREVRSAGLDPLVAENADLIDAIRSPERYPKAATTGNEILILGVPMSGRKSLALRLAQEAGLQRALVLHNAANVDALAWSRDRILRMRGVTWLLLIPNLDRVFARADDDEVVSQLEALVEASSEQRNIVVIATADSLVPDSTLDNLFGIKLLMPGTTAVLPRTPPRSNDALAYHRAVAEHYVKRFAEHQVQFSGIQGLDRDAFIARLLSLVSNPAEIEDICTLCLNAAIFRSHHGGSRTIDAGIIDRALARTLVGVSAVE